MARPRFLDGGPLVARRGVQFVVDLVISALLCALPMAVFVLLPSNPDGSLGALLLAIPLALGVLVLAVVISWCYWAWLPGRRGGRTLAMGWLGLRVETTDGALRWPASSRCAGSHWPSTQHSSGRLGWSRCSPRRASSGSAIPWPTAWWSAGPGTRDPATEATTQPPRAGQRDYLMIATVWVFQLTS